MNFINLEPFLIAIVTLVWGFSTVSKEKNIASIFMAFGILFTAYIPFRLQSGKAAQTRLNELSFVATLLASIWFWFERQTLHTNFALHLLNLTPIFLYPKLTFQLWQDHQIKLFNSKDGIAITKHWFQKHFSFSRRSLDSYRPLRIQSIYFFVCLFTSVYFLPWQFSLLCLFGLGVLYCAASSWSPYESNRKWFTLLSLATLISAGTSVIGEMSIEKTEDFFGDYLNSMWRRHDDEMPSTADVTSTSIGRKGHIDNGSKLIARIEWTNHGYLRNGIFSYTSDGQTWWSSSSHNEASRIIYPKEGSTFDIQNQDEGSHHKSSATVLGLAQAKISLTFHGKRIALPLPIGTQEMFGLPFDKISLNRFNIPAVFGSSGFSKFGMYYDPNNDDSSPPNEDDLNVPESLKKPLHTFLDQTGSFSSLNPDQIALMIQTRFKKDWKYTLNLETPNGTSRSLSRFLLLDHQGHCEYFATATTLALRQLGIPARYNTGFLVNEFDSSENLYWVRARDAHAWSSYWNGKAWITLDSTPSSAQSDEDTTFFTDWLSRLQYKIEEFDPAAFANQVDTRFIWLAVFLTVVIVLYRTNIQKKIQDEDLSSKQSLLLCDKLFKLTHLQRLNQETAVDYWVRVADYTNMADELKHLAARRSIALFQATPHAKEELCLCDKIAQKIIKKIKNKK